MKKILFAAALCAGIAAQAQAADEAVPYRYGMELDIAHLVSVTPIADVCGVVPAQMTYLDSEGTPHTVNYMVFGTGCAG